jgi:hypothetical protein
MTLASTSAHTGERATRLRSRSTDGTYLLAGVGILIVAYASWTWGAWLLAGPTPITAFRDTHSLTLWVARCYELAMVITAVVVLVVVIRGCLRERRMTFDAKMIVAGFFTLFWDPMVNWMQPNFFYSSQWINVNTWVSYAPFVVNPTASQMPQPIVFIGLIYPFGWVPFAMLLNTGMSLLKRRWPELSNTRLIGLTYLGALTLCLALEAPMFLLNLWGLPGAPSTLALFDDNHRFAWAEYLTTAVVFTTVASIRFFKNDKGQTLPERGLDRLSAAQSAIIATLASITLFAMSMWVLLLLQLPAGLHTSPYPQGYPDHMINNLCDVKPGMHTDYRP